jgi:hypothetical protein
MPRYKLIACEILYRECCAMVARSPNYVDVEFMPKALHDLGQKTMSARLQEMLDQVDPSRYDAILLGYALCSNGIVGLRAPGLPMVVPRAHDCITLFLGDRERYSEYFTANPGTYFKTPGWVERGDGIEQLTDASIQKSQRMTQSWDELVEKYGEDNAKFLWEQMVDMTRHYRQVTYIRTGVAPEDAFEREARELAEQRGWEFESLQGDLRLIDQLIAGDWDDRDFLVVPPGQTITPSYDQAVVKLQ